MSRKILLVEDDPGLHVAMGYMIENLGFELTVAEDVEQALAAIPQGPYAAAIVDYFLRNIPSTAIIAELRSRYPTMPVICSTAARAEQIDIRNQSLAPNAFLYKPFEARELRDLITTLVV
jgi:DNA-binding response OmpR family regulator